MAGIAKDRLQIDSLRTEIHRMDRSLQTRKCRRCNGTLGHSQIRGKFCPRGCSVEEMAGIKTNGR